MRQNEDTLDQDVRSTYINVEKAVEKCNRLIKVSTNTGAQIDLLLAEYTKKFIETFPKSCVKDNNHGCWIINGRNVTCGCCGKMSFCRKPTSFAKENKFCYNCGSSMSDQPRFVHSN